MAESNVPTAAYRPPHITDFPALYWDAEGHATLYKSAAEVPEGATPFHPNDTKDAPKRVPPPPAARPPDPVKIPPRVDIVKALTDRHVKFNAQSPTKVLYELLLNYVDANES